MPDNRTGLIEAARLLLEITAKEPPKEDHTGDEIAALYGILKHTTAILHSYTITKTVPELRGGAQRAASEMQRAMWHLEDGWLQRYAASPIENVIPIPLRRAS